MAKDTVSKPAETRDQRIIRVLNEARALVANTFVNDAVLFQSSVVSAVFVIMMDSEKVK